jgi:ABC-type sugar transport systems, ATPase components
LEQVSDSLEEASHSCGATHWQTLKNIVVPLIRPGTISAFFLLFLPALRELTTSVLLYGPTARTIGVAIYALNEDGETVRAVALASAALVSIFVDGFSIRKLLAQLEKGGVTMAMLNLVHVTKLFRAVKAVSELNLAIEGGECFSFLGPSGCGKTTTLRMIAGFEDLDEGELSVNGETYSSSYTKKYLPPEKRNFGMVFQAFAV